MKKNLCILVFLIIIIISLLIYYFNFKNESLDSEEVIEPIYTLTYDDILIDYYSEILYSTYINENDLTMEDGYFDSTSLGEQEAIVTYYLNDELFTENIKYTVADRVKPVIMNSSSYTVEINEDFIYDDVFVIADNYDKNVECNIIGDYDLTKISEYNLNITCNDSSKNVASNDFSLNVVEEKEESYYDPTIYTFDEIVNKYKTDNTKIGLDVSKWQGNIDWDAVKESGAEFVIIRAGYETSYGEFIKDEKFDYNLENAKRVGLDVGVYFYSQSKTVEGAVSAAKFVVDLLDGESLELPIAFDWEIWSKFNSYDISLTDLDNMAEGFIDYVEKYGYEGMNYGSKNYLQNMFSGNETTWVAHYEIENTTYTNDYLMWQMTSAGTINGISGYVDVNVLYY